MTFHVDAGSRGQTMTESSGREHWVPPYLGMSTTGFDDTGCGG